MDDENKPDTNRLGGLRTSREDAVHEAPPAPDADQQPGFKVVSRQTGAWYKPFVWLVLAAILVAAVFYAKRFLP